LKQKRSKRIIALDYDGVLNKLFPPMQWIMFYSRPNDIVERTHLTKLRSFIIRIHSYLPFSLDEQIIDYLPRDIIVISGRTLRSKVAERELKELGFRYLFFRPTLKISELEWKIRMCKILGITEFYDDRPYIVEELRQNGINAYLWRKKRWKL
jgi:hypothetical protein